MIVVSLMAGWLCGTAFWYGWSSGSLAENGFPLAVTSPTIWPMWPLYLLGRECGQRYTARKLAPERMRQKLLQEAATPWRQQTFQFPLQVPHFTTTAANPWYGAGGGGGVNTP